MGNLIESKEINIENMIYELRGKQVMLDSDVAVEMSLKIVNTFIAMRKYISSNLLEQKYINNQVMKNAEDIKILQESFSKFEEKRTVNEIYFKG